VNLLILGDQMTIDYEILWKVSAGSPRHLAVDKTPQQLHDALCCQSRRFRPPGPSSTRMPALIATAGKCLGDTISTATLWEAFRKLSVRRGHGRFRYHGCCPSGSRSSSDRLCGCYFHKMKATFLLCLRTYLPCIIPTQHEHRRTVLSSPVDPSFR